MNSFFEKKEKFLSFFLSTLKLAIFLRLLFFS